MVLERKVAPIHPIDGSIEIELNLKVLGRPGGLWISQSRIQRIINSSRHSKVRASDLEKDD